MCGVMRVCVHYLEWDFRVFRGSLLFERKKRSTNHTNLAAG